MVRMPCVPLLELSVSVAIPKSILFKSFMPTDNQPKYIINCTMLRRGVSRSVPVELTGHSTARGGPVCSFSKSEILLLLGQTLSLNWNSSSGMVSDCRKIDHLYML